MTREEYLKLPIASTAQIAEAAEEATPYFDANGNYTNMTSAKLAMIEYHLFTHYGARLERGEVV